MILKKASIWINQKYLDEFINWFFLRLLLPLIPVVLQLIMNYYLPKISYPFPNRSIIVMAFMFPLISMHETKRRYIVYFWLFVSIYGIALFFISIFAENWKEDQFVRNRIYSHGLYLYISVIIIHLIPKLIKLFKPQDTELLSC